MSTKIYDGFVIKTPIARLVPFLSDCREKLEPFAKAKLLNRMHDLILEAALGLKDGVSPDVLSKGFLPSDVRPDAYPAWETRMRTEPLWWSHLLVEWIARTQDGARVSVTDRDDGADVRLWLYLMPRGRNTYGIPCGDRDMVVEFLKLPGVEEYGYWNNTDRPEKLTAAQWNRRAKTWDELIPGYFVADKAFRFDLHDDMRIRFPMPTERTMSDWLAANREKLVRSRAHGLLFDYYDKANPKDPGDDDDPMTRFFFLDKLVKQALKLQTDLAEQMAKTAESDIPTDFAGLIALFPEAKPNPNENQEDTERKEC